MAHPDPGSLNDEAVALWDRYDVLGHPELLDAAIARLRSGLGAPGTEAGVRNSLRANLSGALAARSLRSGSLDDLREAAKLARDVAGVTAPGDPHYVGRQTAVGVTLLQYYVRSRDTSVLDEAADFLEVALHREPSPLTRGNLAEGLREQYQVRRDPEVLERALDLARSAAAEVTHPLYARSQSNLALTLMSLPTAARDPAVLAQARQAMWASLAATPAGHPNEVERKNSYARLLYLVHQQDPNPSALTHFVRASRQAENVTPQGHPLRATAIRMRAAGDYLRARSAGNQAAEALSRRWLRHVVDNAGLPVAERIQAAMTWAGVTLLSGADLSEARWAFERTVDLFPLLPGRHLGRSDQQVQIAQFPGLALDAAAYALAAGDPALALLLLEQGRGILLARAVETAVDPAALERAHPELAADLHRLLIRADDQSPSAPRDSFARAELRRDRARQWDALLDTIRAQPGFEGFLRPPTVAELLTAGREGPVVILVVSPLRCDAVILEPTRMRVTPLPHLTAAEAHQQAQAFAEAVAAGRDPARGRAEHAAAEDDARAVLRWLWHAVAEPVLTALGLDRRRPNASEPLPRIWWVPTGPLTFLPLHAAGEYPEPFAPVPPGRCVLDLVVSSYTPTLRTLLHHRGSENPSARAPGSSLVVAMPTTPGAPPLPGAHAEADLMHREIWPEADVLEGQSATRRSVLAALPGCRRVHFACHARSSADAAGVPYLLLHDHQDAPLTVSDIAALRLGGAEFAYLSACDTTRAAPALADEGVHLASAFHVAGFRHVVGTLWRTADDVAQRLAGNSHRAMGGDGPGHVAHALHRAVQEERRAAPSVPTLWSAHIHIGA
ncbi:hypothetical protein Kisp01_24970 [Kineosporia sp. NBRC 101677]|uniref:CHAT domain-containing protein n=1 Tax=Kineosporia sp. NBRC 101677 TaxID=3032197 RepID=UPI0024A5505A|nr:CHAT domain-containing protein [Kineosporia sp. NBRC 101677]GLY15482.1 hypothetical protein Kisp01_24970 [Kineosporia sp. NBRC 101677]